MSSKICSHKTNLLTPPPPPPGLEGTKNTICTFLSVCHLSNKQTNKNKKRPLSTHLELFRGQNFLTNFLQASFTHSRPRHSFHGVLQQQAKKSVIIITSAFLICRIPPWYMREAQSTKHELLQQFWNSFNVTLHNSLYPSLSHTCPLVYATPAHMHACMGTHACVHGWAHNLTNLLSACTLPSQILKQTMCNVGNGMCFSQIKFHSNKM